MKYHFFPFTSSILKHVQSYKYDTHCLKLTKKYKFQLYENIYYFRKNKMIFATLFLFIGLNAM